MQPIPKELQGQKAIPFMEWCNSEIISHFNKELYLEKDIIYDIQKQYNILKFFFQPFTPEMLQEYFEGFEYSDHFNRICYKYHNLLYLKEYTIGGNKCFDLRIDSFEKVNKDYLTLNLFISLCLNRDITLTWKGETE